MAGAPLGTTPGLLVKAAVLALPNQRAEITGELLAGLQHTNSYCRRQAAECLEMFPEELPRWKDRLIELSHDGDAGLQEVVLLYLMQVAQSKEALKILPALEIRRAAEVVLADPKTTDQIRGLAETVRSLAMRNL